MNIILWLVFGALVGWIASIIMKTDAEQGAVANIVIGIVGAFIGGFISRLIGGPGASNSFSIVSIMIAIMGSVILIFLIRTLSGRGSTVHR